MKKHPKHRSTTWALTSLLLLATAAAGCGGDIPDEDSNVQSDALSQADDGACGPAQDPARDRGHGYAKRCRHYRHKRGYHRGRGGNAALATRALIDAAGRTDLEVTTGAFDDGATPETGVLEKLRASIQRPDRRRRYEVVLKTKPNAGTFSGPIADLVHGQALTIDATVATGKNGRDKDRVVVDDEVVYRPDLTVRPLDVPQKVSLGVPTSIAATIQEKMADLGAKADCVLSVDGAAVDRVDGIWVDSGGVVTCHFSYKFAIAGQHALRVEVTNVQPGDYDTRNNAAVATVNVTQQFAFSGSVLDASYGGTDMETVLDGASVLYRRDDTWGGSVQSTSINGTWRQATTFPLSSLTVTASSTGATWGIADLTGVAADSSDAQGACAARSDAAGYSWVTVCTATRDDGPVTTIDVSDFAGDVTYHSTGVCKQTTSFGECTGGYTWNDGSDTQWAARHVLGDKLTLGLRVADATGAVLEAAPTVALSAYTSDFTAPYACDPQPDQTQYCHMHQYAERGVRGTVAQ